MTYHSFSAVRTCAALAALAVLSAESASALPPRSAPSHPTPPEKPAAQLVFRAAWLEWSAVPAYRGPPVHSTRVPNYRPHGGCFTIANIGNAPSGPFVVTGNRLGMSADPSKNEASLPAKASRDDCLWYTTTPPPGDYTFELKAESDHKVQAKYALPITVFSRAGGQAAH